MQTLAHLLAEGKGWAAIRKQQGGASLLRGRVSGTSGPSDSRSPARGRLDLGVGACLVLFLFRFQLRKSPAVRVLAETKTSC